MGSEMCIRDRYENITMHFVSPDHQPLRLDDKLKSRLLDAGVNVFEHHSLDAQHQGNSLLAQTDCLYMTRIQREHNSNDDEDKMKAIDLTAFQLTPERAQQLKEYTPIMHPFPRDSQVGEIPESIDLDPRAMYFRQARNGVWARAALLAHMFGASDELAAIS